MSEKKHKPRRVGHRERCKRYRIEGRREFNKIRRIARHVKRTPKDVAAAKRLDEIGDENKGQWVRVKKQFPHLFV